MCTLGELEQQLAFCVHSCWALSRAPSIHEAKATCELLGLLELYCGAVVAVVASLLSDPQIQKKHVKRRCATQESPTLLPKEPMGLHFANPYQKELGPVFPTCFNVKIERL